MTPSRRSFLRGAGALVALPFLPSLARGATPPRRLVFVMWENGAPMDRFTPGGPDAAWSDIPCLAPIARHKADAVVWSGFTNAPAMRWQGGGHSEAFGAWLTAQPLMPTTVIENDVSVDQAAVPLVGAGRVLPSLQLSLEKGGTGGECPALFPCAYDVAISWQGRGQPLPPVWEPALAFDRLFPTTPSAREKARRSSILDLVLEDAHDLERQVGRDDLRRLDEWMTGIRHLEQRLDIGSAGCEATRPSDPASDAALLEAMFDLIAHGLACDATRVVTLTMGRAASERVVPGLGVLDLDHHAASHHGFEEGPYSVWTDYTAWCVERIGELVDRLHRADGEGGRLLDSTLVVAGSPLGEGARHLPVDLPLVTFGSLGGVVRTGTQRQMAGDRPLADLWLGLLRGLGDTRATFGQDGTSAVSLA